MKTRDALSILDAAYMQGLDDETWLANLAAAVAPRFDRGLGVTGYFVELGGPGQFRGWGHTRTSGIDIPTMWKEVLAAAGPEYLRRVHLTGAFGTNVEPMVVAMRETRGAVSTLGRHGANGSAGLMGIGADGRGVSFATFLPTGARMVVRRGERELWARIAPHLATAERLRRRPSKRRPDAILSPGGALVHAEDVAKSAVTREALRRATVEIDRAKARPADADAETSLSLWRCMVRERWTLVDQFEAGGRRYVVAYENTASPGGLASLSPRERAAATAAALGHGNKEIAYELGLAPSTVATLLARASAKLGVRSRVALVRTVREQMQLPGEPQP